MDLSKLSEHAGNAIIALGILGAAVIRAWSWFSTRRAEKRSAAGLTTPSELPSQRVRVTVQEAHEDGSTGPAREYVVQLRDY